MTYSDVGATLRPDAAEADRAYSVTRTVGHGRAAFGRAITALRAWAPQHALGALVYPETTPIAVGTTVLIVLRAGPFSLAVPDRIVACIDEADAFGFAYGTLPGHLERGEESFLVRLLPDGTVTATITVIAGPAYRVMLPVGPVLRFLQHRALHRYLGALERAGAETEV